MIDWNEVLYFKRDEFGYAGNVEPDEKLVRWLQHARYKAGIPFIINSGIRTPERNAEVGGSPSSSHLTGHAVDIRCASSRDRFVILTALVDVGFQRIGIGKTFIHVDTDPGKPQGVVWLYS